MLVFIHYCPNCNRIIRLPSVVSYNGCPYCGEETKVIDQDEEN